MPQQYPLITLRADINPWDQQEPKESALMYARFRVFLELPPECDRLRQTLEIINTTSPENQRLSLNQLKSYAKSFRWNTRAGAHDRYLLQADRAKMIKQRRKIRDDLIRTAGTLRNVALSALKGTPVEELSPQDVVRFLDLSWRLEKSIYADFVDGLAETTETTAEVIDAAAWTPDERRRRLEVLSDEVKQRVARASDDDEVVA